MTREEQLDWLCRLRSKMCVYMPDDWIIPMNNALNMSIKDLQQEPKTGHCKDCKWWKDGDGEYRRGARAESKCPINTKVVHDGEGYCYLFSKNE